MQGYKDWDNPRFRTMMVRPMARRRYIYRRSGSYRPRSRRSMKKSSGGFGNFHMRWGIGAVAGVMAPTIHPLQDMLITAIAVAPVRLPSGIKGLAQGYVGGRLLRPFAGGFANISSASSDGGQWA